MSTEPAWLKKFAERVCQAMEFPESNSPIGCHYHFAESTWEVTIFASSTEIVGGPSDGSRMPAPFVTDVHRVMTTFDETTSLSWQAAQMGPDDDLGTHLAIRGRFEGNAIWLRLLAEAPAGFAPGRTFNHHTGEVVNAW